MKLPLATPILAVSLLAAIAQSLVEEEEVLETSEAFVCKSTISTHHEVTSTPSVISHEGATWIQLDLSDVNLGPNEFFLKISGTDGLTQVITSENYENTNGWSAVFDGDSVTVEYFAHGKKKVTVTQIMAGVCDEVPPESICGSTDDRVPSTDPRIGRIGGCTGWLISENVFLQAGHCGTPGSSTKLHFTYDTGSAALEDQYSVETGSYEGVDGGVGNDWGIGRLNPNDQTGLLPGVAQGGWLSLGSVPLSTSGVTMRVTGYGTASVDSRSQKTHTGDLYGTTSSALRYTMDTTGGNSGSPAIHDETGEAIGIHTHGGCSSSGGYNTGTRIDNTQLQAKIQEYLTASCSADSDCDDLDPLNGAETCVGGVCVDGTPPTSAPTTTPTSAPTTPATAAPTTPPTSAPTSAPTTTAIPTTPPTPNPSNAPTLPPTPNPTNAPVSCNNKFESCVLDEDCCSNKCNGPNGGKSCK